MSSARLSIAALAFSLLTPVQWLLPVLQQPLLTPPWPGEMTTSGAAVGAGMFVFIANLVLVVVLSVGAGVLARVTCAGNVRG